MLQTYLKRTSPDSAWWAIAYTHYAKVGAQLDLKVLTRASFIRKAAPQDLRIITSVSVGKDVITLSEPVKDAVERLGKDDGEAIPLFPDSKIIRWRFVDRGVDLLAKDKVLAVFLTSKKAPPVVLQQVGVAGDMRELKVGMSETVCKDLMKDQRTGAAYGTSPTPRRRITSIRSSASVSVMRMPALRRSPLPRCRGG